MIGAVSRLRSPLLALGLASLFFGVWAGLVRFGWSLPTGRANLVELHGPLMVFGFLGTVISLERAVALRRPWGYAAPAGALLGTALLFAGVRQGAGELVLLLAGCVLAGLFVVVRAHATAPAGTLLLATLVWVAGDALWLHGGLAIPFRRPFYLHVGLLHAGVALRIAGDLGGDYRLAQYGALLNAIAIGLFLLATFGSAVLARVAQQPSAPARNAFP
jgi:hypothetical protein